MSKLRFVIMIVRILLSDMDFTEQFRCIMQAYMALTPLATNAHWYTSMAHDAGRIDSEFSSEKTVITFWRSK